MPATRASHPTPAVPLACGPCPRRNPLPKGASAKPHSCRIIHPTMDTLDTPQLLSLAAALGFVSGIRLYAVLLIVGLTGYFHWAPLPPGLEILSHPVVLGASALMVMVEFLADKIPALDSLWDGIHTFIRIPAGAALAAAAVGGDSAAWSTVAMLMGGSLAATSHATKAGMRAAINTSPEPFSNIAMSSTEDIATAGLPHRWWRCWCCLRSGCCRRCSASWWGCSGGCLGGERHRPSTESVTMVDVAGRGHGPLLHPANDFARALAGALRAVPHLLAVHPHALDAA